MNHGHRAGHHQVFHVHQASNGKPSLDARRARNRACTSAGVPIASRVALSSYIALWFVIAGLNLWAGVAKAGYTVGDELPIFLLIFGVPAAAAAGLLWRLP